MIEKAITESQSFLKTKAYKHALKILKEENVLTITGTIGSGKKTLASQLAHRFWKKSFTIIPINNCKEIFEYCTTDENLILIINDPFGTSSLDVAGFTKWLKYHDDICYHLENCTRSKVIFTCRLSLFKNARCKSLFNLLYQKSINISEGEYGLSYNERMALLSMYHDTIKSNGLQESMFHVLTNPSLPLICRKGIKNSAHFSKTALDVYLGEIRQLLQTNPVLYQTLLLVLAKRNRLVKGINHEPIINEIDHIFNVKSWSMSPLLLQIDVFLEELEGSFLKESEGIFSFSNDEIYDILAFNASFASKSFTLSVCSSAFFRNNVTFRKDEQYDSTLTICLDENNFDAWFQRLTCEIRKGNFVEIIFSKRFSDEMPSSLLIEKISCLSIPELTEILNGTENMIQFRECIPENISCVLRKFPLSSKLNFLCGIIIAGYNGLFSVIWKRIKKMNLSEVIDEDDLLKAAVIGGNVTSLRKVLKARKQKKRTLPFIGRNQRKLYKNFLAGYSPLCISCACNHIELLHFFIDELAFDMNERSADGDTPLAYAARFGNEIVVRYLLSFGKIDINTKNKDGMSPLMWAVESDGIFDIFLDSGADVCTCTNENETVLMMACELGKIRTVERVLQTTNQNLSQEKRELFINQRNVNGVTALHKACQCQDRDARYQIVHQLLIANADPQIYDKVHHSTPLHLATAKNDNRVIYLLLNTKGDVNCIDVDGVTPLFIAAENGFSRPVSLLLDYRADPLITRLTDGASPLLISAELGHSEVVRILLQETENRNGINNVNSENSTPLLLATLNNNTKICENLLEYGAEVNIANQNGYDPILVASRNGNTKLIHLFLQNGADIDSRSSSDLNTPLHFAVMMGNKSATKYLLSSGADAELKNIEKLTPFVIATYRKQNEIADLLFLFRMFGSSLDEFQTPSVVNPRTPTSLFSTEPSGHRSTVSVLGKHTKVSNSIRIPSRASIASSSASSVVYSIGSRTSFDSG